MKYSLLMIALTVSGFLVHRCRRDITDAEKSLQCFFSSVESKKTSKYFELWNSKIQTDSMQLMSFGIVQGKYSSSFQDGDM